MVKYYVRCIKTNPKNPNENHFTHLKTYVVTDKGIVSDDGHTFETYMYDFNGGENTVEAINKWFSPCGYEFELVCDFTEEPTVTEEATVESDTITFNWDKSRCKNVAEFLEIYFFQNIRDDEDMDSLWYLHDMLHAIEELKNACKEG